MGISSSTLQPQELVNFKKLPTTVPLDTIEIPERPENRRPTNVKWLIILGVFIVVLLPFLIYTLYFSDIRRFILGYDKCGNLCGTSNYKWEGIPCSGRNFTYEKYLKYDDDYQGVAVTEEALFQERHCVDHCGSKYTEAFGRCIKNRKQKYGEIDLSSYNSFQGDVEVKQTSDDLGAYFYAVKWQLIISCLLTILVSMGMIFLFRYAVAFVVWGIMIGCFIGVLFLVAGAWYLYSITPEVDAKGKEGSKSAVLTAAIFLSIFAAILGLVLIWYRRKIRLVILLLKEATKAVFDMPGIIIIPVICAISIMIVTAIFGISTAFMSSAGTLVLAKSDFYIYKINAVMVFTMAYNFLAYLWVSQFITGIQYMVIAGAVSRWYFTRDRSYLNSPIMTSASNAFKYHLGSVALGSMIIMLIQVIKSIILSLINNQKIRAFVESCVEAIETFFKFLSKNAYIITAMHGQAFIRSGKRAAKLIIQNVSDIMAVNYIGDFVLGMAKFLIVVISVLISVGIFAATVPASLAYGNIWSFIIVGVVATLVACISFGVFETTIDTIFICYCEDSLLNDGMAKPYYMSRNLMEFIQDSKEVYGKK